MVGIFAFSILYLADRERKAGVERLSSYKIVPHAAIEADPDLRQQSKRSAYMRNERYWSGVGAFEAKTALDAQQEGN
jgi:hypothetical protein